jgi:predicted metalloendopeptidase
VDDNATFAPLFGLSAIQDYDDAQKTVAQFDQGGFALPGRDFYLNDDAKSVEVRKQYLAHVTNMLKLTGESPAHAATDAALVIQMETELAKAAMDVVKRRDPKNINNKLTLTQIQKLAHPRPCAADFPGDLAGLLPWFGTDHPAASPGPLEGLSQVAVGA